MDIPDILSASAWAEAAEETRTGEWCLTGWGIRDGRLRLELGIPLQLLGPLLLPLLLLLPPPPLLWFLWYSIGDVKAFKKLRWFSKIWLISWIHSWRTPGLAECKTKVSVTSPVLDVSANLHGSLSTFSSRERQLTFTQKENFLYVFSEKHTAQIPYVVAHSQISKCG